MKRILFAMILVASGVSTQAFATGIEVGPVEILRDGHSTNSSPDVLETACIELQKHEIQRLTDIESQEHGPRISIQLIVEGRSGVRKSDRLDAILPLARSRFAVDLEERHDGVAESNLSVELTRAGECIYTTASDLKSALEN